MLVKNKEIMIELIDEIIDYSRKNNIKEIEIRSDIDSGNSYFIPSTTSFIHTLRLEIDYSLTSEKFNESHIRGIRKGLKEKITAEISTSQESLDYFYKLHITTRKKQGMPVQPKNFFKLFYEKIILKKLGFLVIVKKGFIPIAGAIFAGFSNTLTYKYGASNPDFLQYRPNNLLFDNAIREAIDRGYKFLDFGRTDNDNSGLRRFKSGWGAEEKPLIYSYYPEVPDTKYFNSLKEKIVSPLIKYSPEFVSRVIGETMYKYFG
jgi:lipid II:glycine glycyltransferase (peptidoglycan interpeptide bridge formation enzyme)